MIKFHGFVDYTLSAIPSTELINELKDIIQFLNNNVLRKGAEKAEEAARIISHEIYDKVLTFEIESGSKVRLHHAALRIKNHLAKILGSKYKIGIREILLKDPKIIIDEKLGISTNLPYIEEIEWHDNRTIIHLRPLTESDIKRPIIDRLLKLFELKKRRLEWGGKIEHWKLLKKSVEKEPKYYEDPNIVIESIGWIKRIAPGQWLYTPPITHILRRFQEMFIDLVLKPLGFVEAIYPKLIPLEIGVKTGHLKGTPHQMLFASQPISYNVDDFQEWIDLVSVLDEAPPKKLKDFLKDPDYFLCFAQCEPFYWFFGGEIMDIRKLPMKWFDRSGPSFRWESGGLRGLERLVEFHRIEITWIGEPDQVIKIRNELLEKYEYFMDKVLDLEWRWAWVTPWFLVHAGEIEEEKEIDINQPGTIDFEAWLPYRGNRSDQHNWLEIGNISIHGSKYTSAFKIKHQQKDKTIWTACSGFGTQRWLLAFLAQKGFDPDNWPEIVKKYIIRPPKSVTMVTYPKTKKGWKLLEDIEKLFDKLPSEEKR